MAKYKLKLTLNTGEVITSNAIEIPPSITGMEFEEQVPPGFNVTITVSNSTSTSSWMWTKVYDIAYPDPYTSEDDEHIIGEFTSVDGTISVTTTTGIITVCFKGGLVAMQEEPVVTGGVTTEFWQTDEPRFAVTGDGTITFNRIDFDD